jgi:hypothetical protein
VRRVFGDSESRGDDGLDIITNGRTGGEEGTETPDPFQAGDRLQKFVWVSEKLKLHGGMGWGWVGLDDG